MAELVAFVALLLLMFGRDLGRLHTHYIGDGGDNYLFAWNAWWLRHCWDHGQNPFFCDMQYTPTGTPLVLHTLDPLPFSLVALLTPLVGPILAYNLLVIGLYPLAGMAAAALARGLLRRETGGVLAGAVFMLCPFMASKSLGHPNLQCAALLPFFMLCLLRGVPRGGRGWAWRMTLVFTALVLSNVHSLLFAGNLTVWYFVLRLVQRGTMRIELLRLWRLFWPSAIVAMLWGGMVAYYVWACQLKPERYGASVWSPEPLSYVLPLHANSIWRAWLATPGSLAEKLGGIELAVYLGWVALPLAFIGWLTLRRRPAGVILGVIFCVSLALSPGPKLLWNREVVHIAGVPVYLPMGIYRNIPMLASVGQSRRYLVLGYIVMSVAAAAAVVAVRRRWGARPAALATAGLTLLVAFDFGFRPTLVAPPPSPIPPGPERVLEVRRGHALSLYWQTQHGRELVGGYIARTPWHVIESYRVRAGVGWLYQRPEQRGEPPDCSALRRDLAMLDVRYVSAPANSAESQWLQSCDLMPIYDDGQTALYEVDDPPEAVRRAE